MAIGDEPEHSEPDTDFIDGLQIMNGKTTVVFRRPSKCYEWIKCFSVNSHLLWRGM